MLSSSLLYYNVCGWATKHTADHISISYPEGRITNYKPAITQKHSILYSVCSLALSLALPLSLILFLTHSFLLSLSLGVLPFIKALFSSKQCFDLKCIIYIYIIFGGGKSYFLFIDWFLINHDVLDLGEPATVLLQTPTVTLASAVNRRRTKQCPLNLLNSRWINVWVELAQRGFVQPEGFDRFHSGASRRHELCTVTQDQDRTRGPGVVRRRWCSCAIVPHKLFELI